MFDLHTDRHAYTKFSNTCLPAVKTNTDCLYHLWTHHFHLRTTVNNNLQHRVPHKKSSPDFWYVLCNHWEFDEKFGVLTCHICELLKKKHLTVSICGDVTDILWCLLEQSTTSRADKKRYFTACHRDRSTKLLELPKEESLRKTKRRTICALTIPDKVWQTVLWAV